MNNSLFQISLVLFILVFNAVPVQAQDEKKEFLDDVKKAKAAFIDKDPVMSKFFASAEGYVIFPNVGKGAYIIGGAAGNGALYESGHLVGFAKLRQVDVGAQIGGQAFSQVLLFNSEAALDRFKKGNFEITANASLVVLEEGAAKSIEFRDGVAIVTLPKAGAMVEISIGGQKFEYEDFK
ncbi:MAG TPA: lipid-binding SYLF domain-containing protein [Gillisia sp.]|nr:lipid-binding SYLF domain-containing protein [Gillisia sp.]